MASSTQNQGLSKYVTLVSVDGFEFVVLREAACISKAIARMLNPQSEFHYCLSSFCQREWSHYANEAIGGFKEAQDGRCHFGEIKYVQKFRIDLFFSLYLRLGERQKQVNDYLKYFEQTEHPLSPQGPEERRWVMPIYT